jgi:Protein of unknown function (DUF3421)
MKHIAFGVVGVLFFLLTLSLTSSAQGDAYIWVPHGQEGQHPGYQRVVGGKLNDGTQLPVCRAVVNGFQVPGKYYNRMCMSPWHGKELYDAQQYDFFMTKVTPRWKAVHDLSHAQIESGGVVASSGSGSGTEYICRRQLQDGMHPGKYAIGNGNCYVSWAGKEYHFTDGFDILFK